MENAEKDEMLDSSLIQIHNTNAHEAMEFWEKKRLLYTVLLFSVEILVMMYYSQGTLEYGLTVGIVHTIIVNLIANGFYCLGWGSELLLTYYFGDVRWSNGFRWLIFVLGTSFSLILAFAAYSAELSYR